MTTIALVTAGNMAVGLTAGLHAVMTTDAITAEFAMIHTHRLPVICNVTNITFQACGYMSIGFSHSHQAIMTTGTYPKNV